MTPANYKTTSRFPSFLRFKHRNFFLFIFNCLLSCPRWQFLNLRISSYFSSLISSRSSNKSSFPLYPNLPLVSNFRFSSFLSSISLLSCATCEISRPIALLRLVFLSNLHFMLVSALWQNKPKLKPTKKPNGTLYSLTNVKTNKILIRVLPQANDTNQCWTIPN